MASTLLTIRTLLENQIDVGTTGAGTDPTSSLLNIYINRSIRKIAREIKPRELQSASPYTANIVSGNNSIALPATVMIPELVYVADSNSKFSLVRYNTLKSMIDLVSARSFFDTSNTGRPDYYTIRGNSLLFNSYFNYSVTSGINIFGIAPPTSLSSDSDTCDLPEDYDLLIVYESAVFYYQKDDDVNNQRKYQDLAAMEKMTLLTALDTNLEDKVTLDPYTFNFAQRVTDNPNFLFGQ